MRHLQKLINDSDHFKNTVTIHVRVSKPTSFEKWLTVSQKVKLVHFQDVEGTGQKETEDFRVVIEEMQRVKRNSPKCKVYTLAYSNLSFELWLLWHKRDFSKCCTNNKEYLKAINESFHTDFESLSKYKEEKNFQKILQQISLEDVESAIRRCNSMEARNEATNMKGEHKGYKYFKDNPACSVGREIAEILKLAGLKK